jgi:hypothetical protein
MRRADHRLHLPVHAPSDWLRTLQVGLYGYEDRPQSEGRKILSDVEPALPALHLPQHRRRHLGHGARACVSLMMKAAMAYPITKSQAVANGAMSEAIAWLKTCRAVDGQDDPPETLGDFRLLAARGSAGVSVPRVTHPHTNFTAGEMEPEAHGRTTSPPTRTAPSCSRTCS